MRSLGAVVVGMKMCRDTNTKSRTAPPLGLLVETLTPSGQAIEVKDRNEENGNDKGIEIEIKKGIEIKTKKETDIYQDPQDRR